MGHHDTTVDTTDTAGEATRKTAGAQTGTPGPGRSGGPTALSRRSVLRISFAAGATALGVPRLGRAAQATPPVAAPVDGRIPSGVDGVPDAYTKLPTPFTSVASRPGSGGTVRTYQVTYDPPVPGRDDNAFWQELERRLGVTLEAEMQPGDSYGEKLAAITAGGDLPDLTVLIPNADATQYQTIQQGAFADLTPFLSSEALQDFPNLAAFPSYLWRDATISGKIYGVPRETFRTGTVLAFRHDWAERIGTPRPANAEEVFSLLEAFSKGDPNDNGGQDTYGLGSSGNWSEIFVQNMFRVPNAWRRNPDGTLTAAVETDEYAQAVAFMRRMWEAGIYHPDAATMTGAQAKDALIAGKIGGFNDGPGGLPGSTGLRGRAAAIDPASNVGALVPPGHDGGSGVSFNDLGYWGFVAIPSRIDDEERIKELLRVLDYYAAPFGSEEWRFLNFGLEGTHHTLGADGTPQLTEQGTREVGDLTYLATAPTVFFYDRPGDAAYMQSTIKEHVAIGLENPALTVYSPTNAERSGQLAQLGTDRITAIVTGRQPLDSLAQYVADWRGRGGDRIREELQQGLAES